MMNEFFASNEMCTTSSARQDTNGPRKDDGDDCPGGDRSHQPSKVHRRAIPERTASRGPNKVPTETDFEARGAKEARNTSSSANRRPSSRHSFDDDYYYNIENEFDLFDSNDASSDSDEYETMSILQPPSPEPKPGGKNEDKTDKGPSGTHSDESEKNQKKPPDTRSQEDNSKKNNKEPSGIRSDKNNLEQKEKELSETPSEGVDFDRATKELFESDKATSDNNSGEKEGDIQEMVSSSRSLDATPSKTSSSESLASYTAGDGLGLGQETSTTCYNTPAGRLDGAGASVLLANAVLNTIEVYSRGILDECQTLESILDRLKEECSSGNQLGSTRCCP